MTRRAVSALRFALAAAAGTACLFISENVASTQQGSSLISQADARVGRPWTAVSVAGVARRHVRRTYYRSAAYYGGGYAYVPRYGAYAAAAAAATATAYPAVYPTSYYNGYTNEGYGPTYYSGYTNHYYPGNFGISGSYGTYAAVYPPTSYGGYTTYTIAPTYYGSYAAAYPAGYYGGYANRSYLTGRPTIFPRYYSAYRW